MAGSPCPVKVMQDVVDKMHMNEITIVYGQTESSPGCTQSHVDDPLDVRVNTVGRPLFGVQCKIVANGGRVLGVTAKGKDLKEARANAYAATEWVKFDNKYMRHDIGKAIDEA